MPRDWLYVQLADRFHGWPEDYRAKPLGELEYWVSLLRVEGHVQYDRQDMGPDDTVQCDWLLGEDD